MSGDRGMDSGKSGATAPENVRQYLAELARTIDTLPHLAIDRVQAELMRAYDDQRTIFVFGNGGSAATASHMVCDLGKGTAGARPEKRFRIMSLTDNVPTVTAWANDMGYEHVFAEQLRNFIRPHDVVLAISGSGNSPNVVTALQVARSADAVILGLTGYQGGKMKALCDVCIVVPSDNMQIIEDLHHCIAHALFTAIRCELALKASAATA